MAKTKNGQYPIPFDKDGNLMGYAGDVGSYKPHEWRDNYVFDDVLKFEHFERGRSAAHAIFRSGSNNATYQMFLTHLADVMRGINYGLLDGRFTFIKKGKNYGVVRIGDFGVDA